MPRPVSTAERSSPVAVFLAFLRLGLTSFGGPVAHLGYFRTEFVERRRWLDDSLYADLMALGQFLPGPASSQVGMAIGLLRAGLPGALAAWLGFTLPSAVMLIAFAYGVKASGGLDQGLLRGLAVVAVAVVAQAVWAMHRTLCPDPLRATIAVVAAVVALAAPGAATQLGLLAAAGLTGWGLLRVEEDGSPLMSRVAVGRTTAIAAWLIFFALLVGLPVAAQLSTSPAVALFDSFYRTGSLVFGGGHVVLPLIEAEVVPSGWVDADAFLAGYGAAQAVPGPLFTFAAYLGAMMQVEPSGWRGGILCLVAVFLPSFLLVTGALPFWQVLRGSRAARSALAGVNAAVVGLLLAALYDPIWTHAVRSAHDFALALAALLLLAAWRVSPWIVVLLAGGAGALLSRV